VAGVENGSPAATAGLVAGDVIESVDGQSVDSQAAVAAIMAAHHPGDKVSISWLDQFGQQHTATVVLAAGPAA
ncbi:MAG TPA: PDZ domain-containing protein, partial [Streptosporangiaceae bacterium]|nr:PDZ domain-containing protein [Streptosporangiaceae bacterium]